MSTAACTSAAHALVTPHRNTHFILSAVLSGEPAPRRPVLSKAGAVGTLWGRGAGGGAPWAFMVVALLWLWRGCSGHTVLGQLTVVLNTVWDVLSHQHNVLAEIMHGLGASIFSACALNKEDRTTDKNGPLAFNHLNAALLSFLH